MNDLDTLFIIAQTPSFEELKDTVQLVLVLENGDLRAVDVFDLHSTEQEARLKETITMYQTEENAENKPHGKYVDYKFFWIDTNGYRTEVMLALAPIEPETQENPLQ